MLDELDARVGYSSAACGSDLVFIEAMVDRGAEVNILLPFDADDFVRISVAHGGERWKRRFYRALKLVGDHVTFATGEKYLDTEELFACADKVLASMAYHIRERRTGAAVGAAPPLTPPRSQPCSFGTI